MLGFRNIYLWKIRLWKKNQVSCKHKERVSFRCYYLLSLRFQRCWLTTSSYQAIEAKDMCKLPNKPHCVPLLSIRYSQSATLFVTIRSPPTGKLLTEYSGCESRGSFIIVTVRAVTAAKVTGLSRLSLVFSNFDGVSPPYLDENNLGGFKLRVNSTCRKKK